MVARLLATSCLVLFLGNQDQVTPCDRAPQEANAALWYWRCFNELQVKREASERYIALLTQDAEPAAEDELENLRNQWAKVLETAETASQKPYCVFGIDREAGSDALLPHLEPMRRLAKMAAAEATRAASQDDFDLAARRITLLSRMSVHALEDETLISGLVAISIATMACDHVERWINRGWLRVEHKPALVEAIAATGPVGQAALGRILSRERQMSSQWMLRQWDGPEDHGRAVASFKKMGADAVELVDAEDLVRHVQRFDAQMALIVDAAQAGDVPRLEQLCREAIDLQHGVVAALCIAPYAKTIQELSKLDQRRQALLERLQGG